MRFTVSYGRKVKAGEPYEMLEIRVEQEFDDGQDSYTDAYHTVKTFVETAINSERKRLAK